MKMLCNYLLLFFTSLAISLVAPDTAHAQQPKTQTRPKTETRPKTGTRPKTETRPRAGTRPRAQPRQAKREVTVPVNIGVGPTFNTLGAIDFGNFGLAGPIYDDQTFHYGLRISLEAVLDQQFLRENQRLIPREYRRQARNMTEFRFRPAIVGLIPSSLFISPKLKNTGVYGATWTLMGIGLAPISNPVRLGISGNVIATYAFIHSDTIPSPTHFLRPGVELAFDLEVPVSKQFLFSIGWASQFYIPQEVGGSILDFGSGNNALWHIGQAFLLFHVRIPYTTSL